MEVKYTEIGKNIFYNIKLTNEEINSLGKPPYCLEAKVSDKIFRLRVSTPDDDSDFELHYHPPFSPFQKVKEIHATMSVKTYGDTREAIELTHSYDDSGTVTISRK